MNFHENHFFNRPRISFSKDEMGNLGKEPPYPDVFLQFIVYKSVQRQRYKNHETIQTRISFWNYHCLNQSLPSKHHFFKMFTSWWLNQPIWTICSSNWIISPSKGENKTCLKPPSILGADKHSTLWLYFFIPFFSLLSSPWKSTSSACSYFVGHFSQPPRPQKKRY